MENKAMTKLFTNEDFGGIRIIQEDGRCLFCGADVARALGYSNPRDALRRHCKRDGVVKRDGVSLTTNQHGTTTNQTNEMSFITEGNVYRLIAHSKLPKAEEFERWLFDEVVPTIRKTGGYVNDTSQFVEYYFAELNTYGKAAVALMLDEAKRMGEQLKEQAPKVLFADAVEGSKDTISVGDLAKVLNQNGIDIGQQRLFAWLRENGYLIKDGDSKNVPTQKSRELGVMEVKISGFYKPDGSYEITKTPKVTGKGQTYFVNKFIGEKGR